MRISEEELARWEEAFWKGWDVPVSNWFMGFLYKFTRYGSKKMVQEFVEKSPGKCMICSYHRYGVSHGHVAPGTPVEEHNCPEGNRT